jgi:tripartite-type tricarboxylate transporter receptor subunit TctC
MRSRDLGFNDGPHRFLRVFLIGSLTAIASAVAHEPARSQPGFPAKPIHIFIPYGAGGVADLTMRLLAQKLTVLADFTFVSITARFEMLLAVKADSPLRNLQDVVAAARKDPGKLNFGAINPGSTQNLSAHLLKQVSGVDVAIVPYKTTPDLVTAVLRGDVDVGFDFYAGLQALISDNQVRIIATSGEERNPLLRDVPTAKESGFPDYIVTSWNGLAAKAGMPAETLAILNQHINAALSDPALKATASTLGMDARGSTPQEMRDRMAADVQKWAAVIEKAGIEKQ